MEEIKENLSQPNQTTVQNNPGEPVRQAQDKQDSTVPPSSSGSAESKFKFPILPVIIIVFFLIGMSSIAAIMFLAKSADEPSTKTVIPTSVPKKPTPTPDPTANWNTFNNSDLGASFKYPKDYEINTSKIKNPKDGSNVFTVGFYLPKYNASVGITRANPNFLREDPYSKTSFSEEEFYNPASNFWLKGDVKNGAQGTTYEIPKIINLGGNKFIIQISKPIRAYQGVKGNELYYFYYHWLSSSEVMSIVLTTTSDNPKNNGAIQTLQQILSTFKFSAPTGGLYLSPTINQTISCTLGSDCTTNYCLDGKCAEAPHG